MKHQYESEILFRLMERDGFNIPSSVPPYESEIKAYLINQVKQAYPKLTDYEAEWLLYNYTKHLPADFPISSATNVTKATFENVVPFAYQSAILSGSTLVNIVNRISLGTGATETDNSYVLTQSGTVEELYAVLETSLIELNKDYTFIYYIQEKTTTKEDSLVVKNLSYLVAGNNTAITQNIGWNKVKFNVSSFGMFPRLSIAISSSEEDDAYVKFAKDKFALLSGDWTQKELPFDTLNCGMQSVKMPVLTTSNEDGTKTNILTANEDVELGSVGEVKDELDLLTGKITQRTDIRPYQESDESDSEVLTDMTNTRYKLAQEVVKTVDLKTVNESGESVYFMPLEGTMTVQSSGETIQPTFDMSVPVEATTQNLASFIDLEMEE